MIQINPLKSYIDGGVRAALTTPPSASLVSTTDNGLAPKFTSGNKSAASAATTYYFLGWAGSTLKWYQAPFRNIRINSETTDRLGVNSTDPLIISSGNGISVTWDSTNKKIIITNTKPDVNHNTDRTGIK